MKARVRKIERLRGDFYAVDYERWHNGLTGWCVFGVYQDFHFAEEVRFMIEQGQISPETIIIEDYKINGGIRKNEGDEFIETSKKFCSVSPNCDNCYRKDNCLMGK